jgi:hypothetical protein
MLACLEEVAIHLRMPCAKHRPSPGETQLAAFPGWLADARLRAGGSRSNGHFSFTVAAALIHKHEADGWLSKSCWGRRSSRLMQDFDISP